MSETPYRKRSQFVRAGFRLEWQEGQPVLYCAQDWEGRPDWQVFKSREHMAVWIATAVSEMEHEDLLAELDAKRANHGTETAEKQTETTV